ELKTTQLQLIQSAKFESVGQLAAGVAHEVKNPLAIIQQGLTYLADAYSTDDDRPALVLKKLDNAVRRADQVIKGLLDFSVPRAAEVTTADLNAVVGQALSLLEHPLVTAHVTVVKALRKDLPPLNLDPNKIEQVFVNLFMNAIQAMPDGGTLAVRTEARKPTGPGSDSGRGATDQARARETLVMVTIEDTGTGIPAEKLDRVFDPFFTTKPPGQGTGLGLSVTRKIIELHGGTIDIGNRPTGGVRVTLTFTAEGASAGAEETDPARSR
ncbi:MAG: sensor histidine kinase, partial [Candidatus Methylomirabilales bacterium]